MGRTYKALRGRRKFEIGFAGAEILQQLHLDTDLPVVDAIAGMRVKYNVPWDATLAQTEAWGAKLAALTDEYLLSKKPRLTLFDGTDEEWLEWVRSWQDFLIFCGGYTTLD